MHLRVDTSPWLLLDRYIDSQETDLSTVDRGYYKVQPSKPINLIQKKKKKKTWGLFLQWLYRSERHELRRTVKYITGMIIKWPKQQDSKSDLIPATPSISEWCPGVHVLLYYSFLSSPSSGMEFISSCKLFVPSNVDSSWSLELEIPRLLYLGRL